MDDSKIQIDEKITSSTADMNANITGSKNEIIEKILASQLLIQIFPSVPNTDFLKP